MTSRLAVAQRANVPPFHVMDLLAAAAERQRTHGDLVNLVAGQPSTGAPQPVRDEAIRLLGGSDPLGYTVAAGVPELRAAIAVHHGRQHGIQVSADDVIVTTGSSGGFLLAFLAAFEAGDRVAMAFSHRLLAETGVAVAPGIDFDTEAGGQHIRLSFAGPQESITLGLQRLGDWLPAQTT